MAESVIDVLIAGAGPTGLTLAPQLAAFGVRARIVDRVLDRVHESRALAIQPRPLRQRRWLTFGPSSGPPTSGEVSVH
jgi:2-polyprenyl-6-methoxyphenol hydroxylase-like FAD-dependent oxidoreductase